MFSTSHSTSKRAWNTTQSTIQNTSLSAMLSTFLHAARTILISVLAGPISEYKLINVCMTQVCQAAKRTGIVIFNTCVECLISGFYNTPLSTQLTPANIWHSWIVHNVAAPRVRMMLSRLLTIEAKLDMETPDPTRMKTQENILRCKIMSKLVS